MNGSQYTDVQRREAVAQYVVLGNYTRVSEIVNISDRTLQCWAQTEWWAELYSKIQCEKKAELDAALTKTIHDSIDQVHDRIRNGDYVLNKQSKSGDNESQLIRKPIGGKDLMTIGAIAYDKRQIGRNLPTSISTSVDAKALKALQAKFEGLARGEVIEGECAVVPLPEVLSEPSKED